MGSLKPTRHWKSSQRASASVGAVASTAPVVYVNVCGCSSALPARSATLVVNFIVYNVLGVSAESGTKRRRFPAGSNSTDFDTLVLPRFNVMLLAFSPEVGRGSSLRPTSTFVLTATPVAPSSIKGNMVGGVSSALPLTKKA